MTVSIPIIPTSAQLYGGKPNLFWLNLTLQSNRRTRAYSGAFTLKPASVRMVNWPNPETVRPPGENATATEDVTKRKTPGFCKASYL
jgi:hypothetical protein